MQVANEFFPTALQILRLLLFWHLDCIMKQAFRLQQKTSLSLSGRCRENPNNSRTTHPTHPNLRFDPTVPQRPQTQRRMAIIASNNPNKGHLGLDLCQGETNHCRLCAEKTIRCIEKNIENNRKKRWEMMGA